MIIKHKITDMPKVTVVFEFKDIFEHLENMDCESCGYHFVLQF